MTLPGAIDLDDLDVEHCGSCRVGGTPRSDGKTRGVKTCGHVICQACARVDAALPDLIAELRAAREVEKNLRAALKPWER